MLYYGLLYVIFIDYLGASVYFPFLKIPIFIPLGLFIISFASQGKIKNSDIFRMNTTRWLIFYYFLIIVSTLTADVTFYSVRFFQATFGYFFLYFLVIKEINSISKMKTLFGILLLAHIILLILNPQVIIDPATRSYVRHPSFLGDGNDFSWSVTIVFPFTIFLYLSTKSIYKKILCITSSVVLLFAVIGTSSRGAFLAMISILLYQLIKSNRKIKGSIVIAVIVLIALAFAPSAYFTRMETIQNYEEDESAQARLTAWGSAIRMALDHPLLGVGTNHFAVKFGAEYKPSDYSGPWMNAHSIYFKTLGELGFPGIITLLSIIITIFIYNEKRIRDLANYETESFITHKRLLLYLNSSLIGWAVGGAFLSGIQYPHLYMICGLFASAKLIYEQNLQPKVNEIET